ncbi:hypothetical protein HS088_TW21G01158 [Tripterygium wilfordii]|uniref:Uncharacterized protein n=1 Tax=Tripterygium wilfordii TaxID=458696 RepID=A0A7J7C4F4_TRIWF|nr:hypothetical protein HS088_TW21G01158 [Tripterygium wilfordii]
MAEEVIDEEVNVDEENYDEVNATDVNVEGIYDDEDLADEIIAKEANMVMPNEICIDNLTIGPSVGGMSSAGKRPTTRSSNRGNRVPSETLSVGGIEKRKRYRTMLMQTQESINIKKGGSNGA